ncbi:hypothetical protein LTS10_003127 [Elasticomyces elasticus]|nr:hypothetical protein LTS10_003127 [Elasticomyces elasticus]
MAAITREESSASVVPAPLALAPPTIPETPSKRHGKSINDFLHYFCGQFDIILPIGEVVSPEKRAQSLGHDLLKKIRPLFYIQAHEHLLHDAIKDLKARRPSVRDQPDRLQILEQRLGEAVMLSTLTPHSRRTVGSNVRNVGVGQLLLAEVPPSPTLSVKHGPPAQNSRVLRSEGTELAPQSKTNAASLGRRLREAASPTTLQRPSKRRSTSPGRIDGKVDNETTEAPPSPTLAVKHAPSQRKHPALQSKSAETSFATTVNTSFVSDATSNTKVSFSTVATSAPASQKTHLLDSTDHLDRLDTSSSVSKLPANMDGAQDTADDAQEGRPNTLEDHHVRDIPLHGLAPLDVPESMKSLPFDFYQRLTLSTQDFEMQWPVKKRTSFEFLWKVADQQTGGRRFVKGIETDYKDYTLSAKLKWVKGAKPTTGPIFDLDLRPPRKEATNAFQRRAGGDRILVVDLPDLDGPLPTSLTWLTGQKSLIITRVLELLEQDQNFLGRKWVHFHSKQKKGPEADPEEASNHKVTFVAVEGYGIPNIDFVEFLMFAIPLCENLGQFACKAYSRLDLAMSCGKPVLVFEADKIRWARDEMSDDEPDDDRFNDPACEWPARPAGMKLVEMTDGCGLISRGVMKVVKQFYDLDYLPACIQARICHSKGLWHWMPGDDEDDDLWIMIRDSQRKLVRVDLDSDEEWRTLNVIGYSGPAKPSVLYSGFLPILRDRGVPEEAILNLVRQQVDLEGEEFLKVIRNPAELYHWIFVQKDIWGARKANGGKIAEVAGFPKSTDERILRMLMKGFDPLKNSYLRAQVLDSAEHIFTLKAKRFKIRLSKSTSLLGIPDVTGKLRPGEVHLQFSRPWPDPVSGEMRSSLNGLDVTVARNPSMDGSDIQKLRGVSCTELAHLYDVMVFSIHGPRPQAGKLSGGDYDGDTFWVCWEPSLVDPFKNAFAAWNPRDFEEFGISKDTVTLGQVLNITKTQRPTETAVRRWIQRGTAARMTTSMLPIVTLYHGKMTYHDGGIASDKAKLLVELHDYLVDSDKQGYQYDPQSFAVWRLRHGILCPAGDPAHWRFTRKNGGGDGPIKVKPGNCEDALYFGVVTPKIENIVNLAKKATNDATVEDPDLERMYDRYSRMRSETIRDELKRLPLRFKPARDTWNDGTSRHMNKKNNDNKKKNDNVGFDKTAEQCRQQLVSIEPFNDATYRQQWQEIVNLGGPASFGVVQAV